MNSAFCATGSPKQRRSRTSARCRLRRRRSRGTCRRRPRGKRRGRRSGSCCGRSRFGRCGWRGSGRSASNGEREGSEMARSPGRGERGIVQPVLGAVALFARKAAHVHRQQKLRGLAIERQDLERGLPPGADVRHVQAESCKPSRIPAHVRSSGWPAAAARTRSSSIGLGLSGKRIIISSNIGA